MPGDSTSAQLCVIILVFEFLNSTLYLFLFLTLQTPIISSSRSPTHTKSLAPLTSTPIQRQSLDKIHHHHTFTPELVTHHHSPHYPLTSTPILAPLTLSSTHQLTAALELEMEAENGTAVSGISRKRGNPLPEYTAGVGSTMERLMEFDVSD